MSEVEIKVVTLVQNFQGEMKEVEFAVYDTVESEGRKVLLLIPYEVFKAMQGPDMVFMDEEALRLHILPVYKDGMVRVVDQGEIQRLLDNIGRK